jgi:FxsC-like protein
LLIRFLLPLIWDDTLTGKDTNSMGDNWFFLSYARMDRDDDPERAIEKFFEDVNREVRRKKVIKEGDAGFFDAGGIEQGSIWTQRLDQALRTCRSLACVYSAAYFQSEWCGREWAVFHSRLDQYVQQAGATSHPPLIRPVLLDPFKEVEDVQKALQLPEAVTYVQMVDGDYPEEYLDNGLRGLLRRPKKFGEVYADVLDTFVKKLLDATKAHELPEGPSIAELTKVQSAWTAPKAAGANNTPAAAAGTAAAPAPAPSGTRYAELVCVAARRDEMQQAKVRGDDGLVYYGNQGGLDWKLYYPEVKDEVLFLAQKVALDEGFIALPVQPDADILQVMQRAEEAGRVVVIIADTWTLCLDKYRDQMLSHDSFATLNCSVLVAWNKKDSETERNRTRLQAAIRQAFKKKSQLKDERYFVDAIDSPEELKKFLATTLQKIRSQIIDTTQEYVTAAGEAETISQPQISPM